jgi:hypothetical protein
VHRFERGALTRREFVQGLSTLIAVSAAAAGVQTAALKGGDHGGVSNTTLTKSAVRAASADWWDSTASPLSQSPGMVSSSRIT